MANVTDKLLWEYIDGSIFEKDKDDMERHLQFDKTVAARLASFTALHKEMRKEIMPDLLEPLIATQIRFNILKGLDLDAERGYLIRKRDNVIAGVFISLLVCFCGILFIYFLTGSFIASTLSQHSVFFIFPIAAIVLLGGLLFSGYLSYQRTIKSISI